MNSFDEQKPADKAAKPTGSLQSQSESKSEQSNESSSEKLSNDGEQVTNIFPDVTQESFDSIEQFNALSFEDSITIDPVPDDPTGSDGIFDFTTIPTEQLPIMLEEGMRDVESDMGEFQQQFDDNIRGKLQGLQSGVDVVTNTVFGKQLQLATGVRQDVDDLRALLGMCVDEQCAEIVEKLKPVESDIPKEKRLIPDFGGGPVAKSSTSTKPVQQTSGVHKSATVAIDECYDKGSSSFQINPPHPKEVRVHLGIAFSELGLTTCDIFKVSANYLTWLANSGITFSDFSQQELQQWLDEAVTQAKHCQQQQNAFTGRISGGQNALFFLDCGPGEGKPFPGEENGKPEEECKPDYKVEICNFEELRKAIAEEIEKPEDDDVEKKTKLVGWYNCKTGETKLLPVRKVPEGADWKEVGGLQEAIDLLVDCICKEAKKEKEREGGRNLAPAILGIGGGGLEGCPLPTYVQVSWSSLIKVLEFLEGGFLTSAVVASVRSFISLLPTTEASGLPGWGVVAALAFLLEAIRNFLQMVNADPCIKQEALLALVSRVYWTFWERVTPGAYEEQLLAATQTFNFYCPKRIPQQADVNHAFLANTITPDQWRCLTRANGNVDNMMGEVVEANRSKPSIGELLAMRHRGVINQQQYEIAVRQLGFIIGDEADKFEQISKQIPGPADLIRFMVRDVEDQQIVNRFRLDEDFGKKFTGETEKWANWQNFADGVMEREWRAHWRYPGYRQLAEMYQRLRLLDPADPAYTERKDVEDALKADDLPQFWIDRLLEISFRPLTRVDTRRAFEIGAIDKAKVLKNYKELGYTDEAADDLTEFAVQQRDRKFLRHKAVRLFAHGEITGEDFAEWMKSDGASEDALHKAIDRSRLLARQHQLSECIKALRKRFFEGDLTDAETRVELIDLGHTHNKAEELLKEWQCTKSSRGKQASLTQLCNWYENGTIDAPEYQRRLLNLGWKADDADRIIKVCTDRIQAKITRQEQAEMRRQQAEERRRAREEERQRKQEEMKKRKKLKAADQAAKARLSRDKIIADGASKYAKRTAEEFVEVFSIFKQTYNTLYRNGMGRQDVIANAIKEIAEDPAVMDLAAFNSRLIILLTPNESYAN